MMHFDTANGIAEDSKNLLFDGIQTGLITSEHIDDLFMLKRNEFSVRSASIHDVVIMESIEREAFSGVLPLSRISRDISRNNGLYLNAVRRWRAS